jgi:hypothetical protein
MLQDSSSKSSNACPPAAVRRSASEHAEGQHQAGLQRHPSGAIELPLHEPPPRTGRPHSPHQSDSRRRECVTATGAFMFCSCEKVARGRVDKKCDCAEQIDEDKLARGKDRSARDAELVMARLALEPPSGWIGNSFPPGAARAERQPTVKMLRHRPLQRQEDRSESSLRRVRRWASA